MFFIISQNYVFFLFLCKERDTFCPDVTSLLFLPTDWQPQVSKGRAVSLSTKKAQSQKNHGGLTMEYSRYGMETDLSFYYLRMY